ncbi:hypothetical protein SD37_10520 [Amycolatopsis orientalis]|uniref:Glutamate/phenylalanine/leucine/valine/L-tryptophan dehydrogenase C-terminal domain-containing protein n=1 Tax=Amycolatopsis orientalis TaxID=31958 RepID=A0A193BV29_AMYOR|nr:Glu/Leu/Phe/Val dehydrogenase dimerization domain-containing protein [Amycolatopsis orientalis]ANN16030.1 hypothetical protein SD37_10520 [Amycolatopsis orientalis]
MRAGIPRQSSRPVYSQADYQAQVIRLDDDVTLHTVEAGDLTAGPANGGLRIRFYSDDEQAHDDARLLAERMTVKHALYGTGFSGAKIVARADPHTVDRQRLLDAVADVLNERCGRLYTGCDLNTSAADMETLYKRSKYILSAMGSAVDPSLATAHGVFASTARALGQKLVGSTFLVHGIGKVGAAVARFLVSAGGTVYTYDSDPKAAVDWCTALPHTAKWWELSVDAVVLCSSSGVVDARIAEELRASVLVSAANAPFASPEVEPCLTRRQVTWVPDVVSNAGAVICDSVEFYNPDAFNSTVPERLYAFVRNEVDAMTEAYLAQGRGVGTRWPELLRTARPGADSVCGKRFSMARDLPSQIVELSGDQPNSVRSIEPSAVERLPT